MPETPLQQAERHTLRFERAITSQEALVMRMERRGDERGAALGRQLLETFRQSLSLALEHRDRLARAN